MGPVLGSPNVSVDSALSAAVLGVASFGPVDGTEAVLSSCSISILPERGELWRLASRADIAVQFVCFQILARQ